MITTSSKARRGPCRLATALGSLPSVASLQVSRLAIASLWARVTRVTSFLPSVVSVLLVLLALSWIRPALADSTEGPGVLPPRDVAVVVQPAAAPLPAPPADFTRFEAGWLAIEAPSSIRDRVDELASDARDFRGRLASDLGQSVLGDVLVRIARNPTQMAELSPIDAPPFAYASGMAYPSLHLILLSMQAPETWEAPDLPQTLRHELTHLALDEAVSGHHVPRWFNEGLAIQESGEHALDRFKTLWDATLSRSLLPLADLDRSFPSDRAQVGVAYAESADVVRLLMRSDDRARFGSLIDRVRAGAAFERALDDAYGTDVRKLEYEWREEVGHRYGLVPVLTGGGALWTLIAALAVVAFVKRRRRSKAKLGEWAREEAALDAAILAARQGTVEARAQRKERPDEAEAWPERRGPEPTHLDAGHGSQRAECEPGKEPSARPWPDLEAAGAVGEDQPPYAKPGIPVIEHDGRWYTLH